ncbi:MAG: flagellar biosynthesis protein FlgN [Shimia sp.]|jgi:flagellar biosynthesis/type III secretory pathway chaperone|uniref:flagellar biosynthesis protein FlgN n=1 Tax=Shimia sp. TaxID=1954381 RepID=UPI00405A3FF6
MARNSDQTLIDSLDALLDEERALLKAGEMHKLANLLERKEALFEKVQDLGVSKHTEVATLRSKAERNQTLLQAAMSAVRSVADRMKDLTRVRNSLETYTNQGQRNAVQLTAGRKVEKRA